MGTDETRFVHRAARTGGFYSAGCSIERTTRNSITCNALLASSRNDRSSPVERRRAMACRVSGSIPKRVASNCDSATPEVTFRFLIRNNPPSPSVPPMLDPLYKIVVVFEAIGDDKVRVTASSWTAPFALRCVSAFGLAAG